MQVMELNRLELAIANGIATAEDVQRVKELKSEIYGFIEQAKARYPKL